VPLLLPDELKLNIIDIGTNVKTIVALLSQKPAPAETPKQRPRATLVQPPDELTELQRKQKILHDEPHQGVWRSLQECRNKPESKCVQYSDCINTATKTLTKIKTALDQADIPYHTVPIVISDLQDPNDLEKASMGLRNLERVFINDEQRFVLRVHQLEDEKKQRESTKKLARGGLLRGDGIEGAGRAAAGADYRGSRSAVGKSRTVHFGETLTEGYGLEKSAGSEHFNEASRPKLKHLMERRLDKMRFCALLIDATPFEGQQMVAALGIGQDGRRTILGIRQGLRPHSVLDDRPHAVFAALHGIRGKHFALLHANSDKRQTWSRVRFAGRGRPWPGPPFV
jgi:hypothetical protein